MANNSKTLVGVIAHKAFFSGLKNLIEPKLVQGMEVGVEYTRYHYQSTPRNAQDRFWTKVIDFLQEKGCKVVFLDDFESRLKIDARHEKKKKLTLKDAKEVFKREKIFAEKLCKLNILGAAHAINLGKEKETRVVLESAAKEMHKQELIPLNAKQLINNGLNLKRTELINNLMKFQVVRSLKKINPLEKRKFRRRIGPGKLK